MKNKQAERAKKKRRAQRMDEKRKQEDKIYDAFMNAAEGKNIKPYKKRDVIRAYRKLEVETGIQAIVYGITAELYVLHMVYGFGEKRLLRHAHSIYKYISVVGEDLRSNPQMAEEMRLDAEFDVYSLFDGYEPYDGKKVDKREVARVVAMTDKIITLMPMIMYPLYYEECWKSKRMNRIGIEIRDVLIDMLEKNNIGELRDCLKKECKIKVGDKGDIYHCV